MTAAVQQQVATLPLQIDLAPKCEAASTEAEVAYHLHRDESTGALKNAAAIREPAGMVHARKNRLSGDFRKYAQAYSHSALTPRLSYRSMCDAQIQDHRYACQSAATDHFSTDHTRRTGSCAVPDRVG